MKLWRAAGLALLLSGLSAQAQEPGSEPPQMPVVTIDQDRLFLNSAFGQRVQSDLEANRTALAAENRRIEAELIAREKELTDQRATLPRAEFSELARAFDQNVLRIRSEQEQKSRDLQRQLERERQRFLSEIGPILTGILAEREALVLLDRNAALIVAEGVDITEQAIARIDEKLGDGAQLGDPAAPDPEVAPTEPNPENGPSTE